jgi:outer membrane protein
MNQEMREQKEREFRTKVNDFKELQQRYKNEAQQMQVKHIGRVQEEVEKLIAEIGKTDGYLIIIEKLKGGVWYHPTTIDLTDRIIQKYNEIYAKKIETDKNSKKDE